MSKNHYDFSGKVALVTGGSTGIGRATALSYSEHGAKVVIADLNEEKAVEVVELIQREGREALFVKTNTADSKSVEALINKIIDTYGKLDIAFNNAGVGQNPAPVHLLAEEDFDHIINVDLKGVFLCMKYEILAMRKMGGGSIVNTASVAGILPEGDLAGYVAAKHGVVGITRAAALENADHGIRVNAVCPGWVRTPMTKAWEEDKEFHKSITDATPLHRGAEPEEIANGVLYLSSSASSYSTGSMLVIDGAQTVRGLLPYNG